MWIWEKSHGRRLAGEYRSRAAGLFWNRKLFGCVCVCGHVGSVDGGAVGWECECGGGQSLLFSKWFQLVAVRRANTRRPSPCPGWVGASGRLQCGRFSFRTDLMLPEVCVAAWTDGSPCSSRLSCGSDVCVRHVQTCPPHTEKMQHFLPPATGSSS